MAGLFEDEVETEEDGFVLFVNVVQACGKKVVARMKRGMICDTLVLRECYLSANQSITFHGRGESSYLKKAGHSCFWIAKLKPFTPAIGPAEFAGHFITGKRSLLGVFRSDVELIPAIEKAAKVNTDKISPVFPINEYCGLLVGHAMAIAGLRQLAKNAEEQGDIGEATLIRNEMRNHAHRFRMAAPSLINSLRFNNYSARATAAMFEWVYDRPRPAEDEAQRAA